MGFNGVSYKKIYMYKISLLLHKFAHHGFNGVSYEQFQHKDIIFVFFYLEIVNSQQIRA